MSVLTMKTKSGKKRKVWTMWCVFYKDKPSTFHTTRKEAYACTPFDNFSDHWRIGRAKAEEL
jgi:hypothetical protein